LERWNQLSDDEKIRSVKPTLMNTGNAHYLDKQTKFFVQNYFLAEVQEKVRLCRVGENKDPVTGGGLEWKSKAHHAHERVVVKDK
jgi:hypothetical protein